METSVVSTQKALQDSITQDTSSILIEEPSCSSFLNLVSTKFTALCFRTFFQRLRNNSLAIRRQRYNLALVMAQRMPPNVKEEVVKMIRYYEEHQDDQFRKIHELVEENTRLRRKMESKERSPSEQEDKENIGVNESSKQLREKQGGAEEELHNCILDKNKQISQLNKQITDLHAKVKKYKKRIYELEARSPIKVVSDIQ